MLTRAAIRKIFEVFAKHNPAPKTELNYTNPFTLLVAVVMSAQMTDSGVNRATEKLFAAADTPAAMVKLGLAGITKHIKSVNFFNTKAKNILALSKMLVENFGGEVPRERADLESLPGVGRKTANVVMNVVHGAATMAVDTHVFRVGNRIGLAPGKTPREVEDGLMKVLKILPPEYAQHAHHWLILHGRYTCTARAPKCGTCPIFKYCQWPNKTKF
jgi:endonuclease-3